MDFSIIDFRAAMTVLQVVVFGAIVWWAYSSSRKSRFDAAASIPLHDDEEFAPPVVHSKKDNPSESKV